MLRGVEHRSNYHLRRPQDVNTSAVYRKDLSSPMTFGHHLVKESFQKDS